jgi:acyl-CoA hydrolase
MDPKPVSESCAVLSHWMGLTDANGVGNVHGGTVMKLADEAAALAAIKHSRTRVVTVGMDRMTFLVPISVGELVTLKATVNAAWRSSMEIGVRVEAENPRVGGARHTNTAYLTMVALDSEGRPTPVPDRRDRRGAAAGAGGRDPAREPVGRAGPDPRAPGAGVGPPVSGHRNARTAKTRAFTAACRLETLRGFRGAASGSPVWRA